MLLAFIPRYLIAVSYQEPNKAEPDCGTTFTWASRAIGPKKGWMGGWGIIGAVMTWTYCRGIENSARVQYVWLSFEMVILIFFAVFVSGLHNFSHPDWLVDGNGNNGSIFGIGAEAVVGVGGLLIGFILMAAWRISSVRARQRRRSEPERANPPAGRHWLPSAHAWSQ